MKKAVFCFLLVTALMTQLSFADANRGEYEPVPTDGSTETAYLDGAVLRDGVVYLRADDIEWYEGEEANVKFREIEQDPEMTEAPDGYYIVNGDPAVHTLQAAENAEVYMQLYNRTGNVEDADIQWNERISLAKFVELMNADDGLDIKQFPYHLEVENGKVVKITQQYIP